MSLHRQDSPRIGPPGERFAKWVRCRFLALPIALPILLIGTAAAAQTPNPSQSINNPAPTTPPDAGGQKEMREPNQEAKQADLAVASQDRKKQIADDSAMLLKLATELKTEVDKTTKDTLSLNVIRKADEIERLAHNVKEKMKLTAGGS
jgi:hypothetical protein